MTEKKEPYDRLLSKVELGEWLGYSAGQIERLHTVRTWPCYRLGVHGRGAVRFLESDILKWLATRREDSGHRLSPQLPIKEAPPLRPDGTVATQREPDPRSPVGEALERLRSGF